MKKGCDIIIMKELIKKNSFTIATSCAFSALIGIFGPIEFYFSNKYSVWYDLYNILPMTLVVFIFLLAITLTIGLLLGGDSNKGKLYAYVLTVLTLCLYIQGNYIKVPYGEMNGEAIEWDKYAGDELKSSLIWIALIAIAIIIYRKKQSEKMISILKAVMVCLMALMIFSLAVIGVMNDGFEKKKAVRPIDEKAYSYSKEENLIILVLDTFDSRVFEDYILDGNEQKVAKQYEDFTYYRDTMGTFTLTNYAFPHLLTGEKFLGDMYYEDYIEKAYGDAPLLKRLNNEGWSVRIHTDQCLPENSNDYFDNTKKVTYASEDNAGLMSGIYKYVMFKYFPTSLKKYVYYPYEYLEGFKSVKTIDGVKATELSYTEDSWGNKEFYDSLKKIEVGEQGKNCQIYHIKGLHALRDLDSNLNHIDNAKDMYSLQQEAAVVSDIVVAWLAELKQVGVYDNSSIIIMADHGSVEYLTDDDNFAQCPLLMIKAKNEHHDFEISQAPVSYEDLQGIYQNLLDGDISKDAVAKVIGDGETWDTYSVDDLSVMRQQPVDISKTVRRRYMIFHKFAGNLGGKSTGSTGYELYSDYPAYFGRQIMISEKTFP